jgi:hypothetical protein
MSKGKLFDVLGSDYMVGTRRVKDIVDEMMKDFPADNHGLEVDKVMPWFYKWFGDEL